MSSNFESLRERRWWILAAAMLSFFSVGTTFFAIPALVGDLIERFGISHFQVGVLMGAIAIPAIFLSIPLGFAVDRWPLRRGGESALGIMLAGAVLFALAPNFLFLLLGRLCFGLGGLMLNLLLARLLSEAFAGRELSLAMGSFMAVYPAAMIVVFRGHPWLSEALGWRAELLVLASLVMISWPLYHFALPPDSQTEGGHREILKIRSLLSASTVGLCLSWMFFFAAFAAVLTFAPEWVGGKEGLSVVSLIMWVSLLASPLSGALMDRRRKIRPWLSGGMALFVLMLALMAFDNIPISATMLMIGLCAAIIPTASYALPARVVDPASIGLTFGMMTACSNLGTLIGPSAAGALRDATGSWNWSWASLAFCVFLGFAATLMIRERAESRDPGL